MTLGTPVRRIDGVAKVTGAARYASDEPVANPAFAYLVTSSISRGSIQAFQLEEAHAVPGVIDILTYQNIGTGFKKAKGPDGGDTTEILESSRSWHNGQIIAIVLADTFEAAREAANKVQVTYQEETPSATFDSAGVQVAEHKPQRSPDPTKGSATQAFANAPIKFEGHYSTPTQHHNPIELFTVTCAWDGDHLTIYEPSQFMAGSAASAANQFDLPPDKVRAISRYVGGAFGSKGPNPRTHWIARAARRIGRPVKLVPTRDQGFTIATYRAETRHAIKLGADRNGRLISLSHEGWEISSRPSGYNVSGVETTARMYACPNIHTAVSVVHADRNTPGFMRAPPETPYMFALESAMDELAHELRLDPIELRRINDTQVDPVDGKPYSSRSLMQCFDQAAAKFDWKRRKQQPGSTRAGDWLVGFGCATSCYPSNVGPAAARVALTSDGKATVDIAGHEIGTGAYTVVAIVAARTLGIAPEDVTVRMGDSDLPPLMIAGGSNNAASASLVVAKACKEILARRASSPTASHRIEVYAEHVPEGLPPDAISAMNKGKPSMLGGASRKDVTAYALGAHFVEVHIHSQTREIRVKRITSAFAAGTLVNSLTAYSQFMGGTIWGISAALHEATEIDPKTARYANGNLADYLVPVNADIPEVDIIMVPESDTRVNALGIKGIGEIGIVGMNAAVANAVFNATGKRIRDLPIRVEKLL
ncbi:MAG: xanthine dehydrogenase family protein molybdopterin-binding subunit [Proteobacteria bacterium]|nr:xanthine dehydrogenase family protein molybdopterin-binding subunit [Pseudomonadota bacterium]